MRLIGSVALHAVLLGALWLGVDPIERAVPRAALAIAVVQPLPVPQPKPDPAPGGGGEPASAPARSQPTRAARPARSMRSLVGEFRIEANGGHGDGDGGGGNGNGNGNGIGLGTGGSVASAEIPHSLVREPIVEAPPAKSLARPPILIYPRKSREVGSDGQFVARLQIDREGYVVGAKLVRGFGVHRDEQAGALVWRFRYAPALDAKGRPIAATIEQGFLVD